MYSSLIIPFIGIFGTVTVAVLNYFFLRRRDSSERLFKFIDNLCSEINETADFGMEYWIISGKKTKSVREDLKKREYTLLGKQQRVISLFSVLYQHKKNIEINDLLTDYDAFIEMLTGGEFQVVDRKENLNAASSIQSLAATLTGNIRKSFFQLNDYRYIKIFNIVKKILVKDKAFIFFIYFVIIYTFVFLIFVYPYIENHTVPLWLAN